MVLPAMVTTATMVAAISASRELSRLRRQVTSLQTEVFDARIRLQQAAQRRSAVLGTLDMLRRVRSDRGLQLAQQREYLRLLEEEVGDDDDDTSHDITAARTPPAK